MPIKHDIQIVPGTSGAVEFSILKKANDSGLLLLQRLYVLMFSNTETGYRGGDSGVDLLELLNGANEMPDDAMNAMLNLAATYAVLALDQEDRDKVASFDCVCLDGEITSTLELTDGTTLEGSIKNE